MANPKGQSAGGSEVRWDQLEQQLLGFEPLGSRLRPPRSQVELVPREKLVGRLLATRASLVLVTAPAGAGKSICLEQWMRRDPRASSWLQLDGADSDPVNLLLYLAVALGTVAPIDPSVLEMLQLRHPPVADRVLPSLSRSLDRAAPFLLVLDDAHLVSSDASWSVIEFLLEQLPPGAQLAIGSRGRPRLPMARLRAGGRVQEFRTHDLAMDGEEARLLLAANGCDLSDECLAQLLSRTEGWATGLYLSALAGATCSDGEWLGRIRGDQHDIASYLTAEVLERQPRDLQQFLLQTSILDRLSPSLCRAVTERDDAGTVLTRLTRESLFVMTLDDRQEWYRYHHLFGELLRSELERRQAGSVPRLNARAAVWHHERGDDETAVGHWMAAGEIAAAAEPAFDACAHLVDRGQVERAKRLLDRFSDEQLTAHTPLTMASAWLYGTVVGEPGRGERWIRAACTAPPDRTRMADGGSSWRSFQLSLRAFLAPDGISQMVRDAQEALEDDLQGEELTEGRRVLAVASYLSGRQRQAERLFADVVRASEEPSIRGYCLAFLALLASDQQRWDEAADFERRASEQCPEMTLDISPGMFLALPMLLARVKVQARGGDAALDAERERCAHHLQCMVPQAPWRVILGAVVLGEAALSCGDLEDAERWAARAESVLKGCSDAGMLAGRVKRLREAVEQRRLADPITAAERRVLELLPTQLTAAQIAARLFVSTNTAKTHMRHLYAKLGVTSRNDAVERACTLGLLASVDQD